MVEEIAFKGLLAAEENKQLTYKPYTPEIVKMINQGNSKPPLCDVGDGLSPPIIYEIRNSRMFVFLHLIAENEEWDIETPLALCNYVKPEGDMLFNNNICEEATQENARREVHNKFIVDIFREFMPRYDCGASANKMTMPQPPENFIEARKKHVEELKKDKFLYTKKAVEYLSSNGYYCGLDYEFDDAWSKADDVCFENEIKKKQSKKKVRVRLEGCPACWWDGISKKDEMGHNVKWVKGESHTFITPDIKVVEDDSSMSMERSDSSSELIVTDTSTSNPFIELFDRKSTIQQPSLPKITFEDVHTDDDCSESSN